MTKLIADKSISEDSNKVQCANCKRVIKSGNLVYDESNKLFFCHKGCNSSYGVFRCSKKKVMVGTKMLNLTYEEALKILEKEGK